MKKLIASLIDSILVFGLGALLLMLTILVMKVIGFQFEDGVTAWAYAVSCGFISLIYYPITEATKLNSTIGKKLLGVGASKKTA